MKTVTFPAGDWIPWTGGTRPVEAKMLVEIVQRDELAGKTYDPQIREAGNWDWYHDNHAGDIMLYRIIGLSDQ